ncbi:MAG TPA: TldD/PmbA family protein [Thermoanaerobaculia bacterium]|nr:TldD/PmbA family protein [Thermoanaerobaculia bacterium]
MSFDLIERALEAAGGDEADANFISSDANITRFANSSIIQNMSEISAELTVRVAIDGAIGVASTTSFERGDIAEMAAVAREAARHSLPLRDFAGLYRGSEPVPDLPTFHRSHLTPGEKARALGTMFDRGREAGVRFAGSYGTDASSVACGNSHGVRRSCTFTVSEATVIAIRGQESGYATDISRRGIDLLALGSEATEKAMLRSGVHEKIDDENYDAIIEPAAIAEVMEWMNMIAFSGQAYEDGSSFFVDHLGKRVVGRNFTLADDALDPDFMPFPFDMEGLPKRRVALIENGIARTPVVDKAYADRLGVPATANGWALGSPDHGSALHLSVAPGDATREELIRSTKRGIWVTRFNYVNGFLEPKTAMMTGTTRDGTFLIRDGEVVARLPNLRWTQSMVEAFSRIEGLTRDRRRTGAWSNGFGGTIAPAIKILDWHFG